MKSQSQPYTLHLSSIYRRHYRTKLVSVNPQKIYLLDFILRKTLVIIEIMFTTLYVYDYDEENKQTNKQANKQINK